MSVDSLIMLGDVAIQIVSSTPHSLLTSFSERYPECAESSGTDCAPQLVLNNTQKGFVLTWNKSGEKPLLLNIDVNKVVNQLRSFPAAKQGAFNQALGKRTRSVIDATGGWGGDALLMCTQGYQVTILERNPVMALLLSDAMQRLGQTSWAQDNEVRVPKVIEVNAVDYFNSKSALDESIVENCVYLDPMFPPKKKKKAAVNKQMQLLQWMVGEDVDATELVTSSLNAGAQRVAVKRPDYAKPLYRKPSIQFSSKLVHYDVYLIT